MMRVKPGTCLGAQCLLTLCPRNRKMPHIKISRLKILMPFGIFYMSTCKVVLDWLLIKRMICTSTRYIKRSPDLGMNWDKSIYRISWHQFYDKNRAWTPLQRIYFKDETTGYAMTSTWLPDHAPHITSLAVLKTEDSGDTWEALNILDVPSSPSSPKKDSIQAPLESEEPIYLRIE